MPDDFDDIQADQGTGNDDIAPSTVADTDQDLLSGTDDVQPDGLDIKPPTDDDEGSYTGTEVISDSDLTLLEFRPEQGVQNIRDKIEKFVKNQQKSYTRRMSKIAKESKPNAAIVKEYQNLNQAVQVIAQNDPEYVKGLRKRLEAAAKGDYSSWGGSGNPKPSKKIESVNDLMGEMRDMIKQEMGTMRGDYTRDKASDRVNALLAKTKSEKLHSLREDMISTLSANPSWNMKRVLGSLDPDLLMQLNGPPKSSSPSSREESSFTTPAKRSFKTLDDAFDSAIAKHGDPELMPPA